MKPALTFAQITERDMERLYRKNYNRGRKSAGSLDAADSRHEPEAWYDGYYDQAAGRRKFHMMDCRAGKIECSEHKW